MQSHEDGSGATDNSWKTYSRSVSWTDRSTSSPNPRLVPNTKSRPSLPPLQPLSIARKSVQEWPQASSDDLGVWPDPKTPRDFELKSDKLRFFDKECSKIADHIYLGSDAVAKNREILRRNGITHVLNCVGFVFPEYFKSDLVYKTLWLRDSPSEDITSILYDVFDYFEDVRERNGRVFVHCCQGVSRSTSLVIAYLMWRKGQSFEDAFQFVKDARGVTNPNIGFASQLLQCQKRVHAMPPSPNSLLRMYKMAPYSSYDPLHLVPKMLNHPGPQGLDSRGAFVVLIPAVIYVWIGKNCKSMMANQAKVAANQVVRYERAKGPIVMVHEEDEPLGFWEALASRQLVSQDEDTFTGIVDKISEKRVYEYDLEFEIFYKALSSGVLPPLPVPNSDSETCLPAREDGWGKLRERFANSALKESCDRSSDMIIDDPCEKPESPSLDGDGFLPSSPSVHSCQSLNSFLPPGDFGRDGTEDISDVSPPSRLSLKIQRSMSADSFSRFLSSCPGFSPKSSMLSPSTPESASSFTFSPSSSNWSDFSSCQLSPSSFRAATDRIPDKANILLDNPLSLLEKSPESRPEKYARASLPSIAERRGSHPPPLMVVPLTETTNPVQTRSASSSGFDSDQMDA